MTVHFSGMFTARQWVFVLCRFLTEMKAGWDSFISRCLSFRNSEVVVSPTNCNMWPTDIMTLAKFWKAVICKTR